MNAAGIDGWTEWRGGACPVPRTARVEVMQDARQARGLALAFNWHGIGPDAVRFWRFERAPQPVPREARP